MSAAKCRTTQSSGPTVDHARPDHIVDVPAGFATNEMQRRHSTLYVYFRTLTACTAVGMFDTHDGSCWLNPKPALEFEVCVRAVKIWRSGGTRLPTYRHQSIRRPLPSNPLVSGTPSSQTTSRLGSPLMRAARGLCGIRARLRARALGVSRSYLRCCHVMRKHAYADRPRLVQAWPPGKSSLGSRLANKPA